MNKQKQHIKVEAFTIFEVTVVLAIMSVLISIISLTINRFNEQLKITADVAEEMNQWRLVRSTIWKDFYHADSIHFSSGELLTYNDGHEIKYGIQDDQLFRSYDVRREKLNIEASEIKEEMRDDAFVYSLVFPWKGEDMILSYHHQPALNEQINNYFDQLN